MIKLFERHEDEKYIIIKILFIKITFKKKMPKSDIDAIVWWIPFKSLRNAVRNLLINRINHIDNRINHIDNRINHIEIDDLLTYMKNTNNININYLFSLKKELVELKGNQGKNKKAIYTCITNRYDNLFVHTYINNDWDYICFTDDKYLIDAKVYGNWIIKPLYNYGINGNLDNTRINRWHKLHPHVILEDYDYSLYVDANIDIKTSYIFECVDKVRGKNIDLSIPPHFEKDCIYDEADTVIKVKLDNEDIVRKQIKLFREEGFPEHYGLTENSIIYRNHNNNRIISIMEEWWHFVENYSKRDQLSLFYILWKNNMQMEYLTDIAIKLDIKNFDFFPHRKYRNLNLEELYKKGV